MIKASFGDYLTHIKGLLYTKLRESIEDKDVRSIPVQDPKRSFELEAVFKDDSKLEALVVFSKVSEGLEIDRYTYQYTRESGFFFSYEMEDTDTVEGKESQLAELAYKPHCHMHVGAVEKFADCIKDFPAELRGHDGPHFMTFLVTLDYIFAVIIVNYLPMHKDILKQLYIDQDSFLDYTL